MEVEVDAFIAARSVKRARANTPGGPGGLRAECQVLRGHDRAYAIDDAAAVAVLTRAAECIDVITEARAAVAKEGALIKNQYDIPKAHPGIAVAKDGLAGFLACMRLIGVDVSGAGVVRDVPPWADQN